MARVIGTAGAAATDDRVVADAADDRVVAVASVHSDRNCGTGCHDDAVIAAAVATIHLLLPPRTWLPFILPIAAAITAAVARRCNHCCH